MKQARRNAAYEWVSHALNNAPGSVALEKLPFPISEVIDTLTEKQLRALNALLAGAYQSGAHDTRKSYMENKRGKK